MTFIRNCMHMYMYFVCGKIGYYVQYIYHFLYDYGKGKEGHNETKPLFFNVLEMSFVNSKKLNIVMQVIWYLFYFLWKVEAYMCICTQVY